MSQYKYFRSGIINRSSQYQKKREHPNQHCLLLLRLLHNCRLRTPKGTPKGIKGPLVTSGSHVTTTKRKKTREKAAHAHNLLSIRATSGQGISSGHVIDVTFGQKVTLGRIWCNFRLRMRRTYFRTRHVTGVSSGHVTDVTSDRVTSGSTSQHLRKYGLSCAHILLTSYSQYLEIISIFNSNIKPRF